MPRRRKIELGTKRILYRADYDGEDDCLHLEMDGEYLRLEADTDNKALETLADALSLWLECRAIKAEKEAKRAARKKK